MSADTQTTLSTYIAAISKAYATGKATEHSYRPAIKALVEGLVPDVVATNEPKRIECGAPDIILTKDDVPVGFIETKIPFDADLEGKNANREQFSRYLAALDKVVFTDFLRFRFFEKGRLTADITLGGMSNEILAKPQADGSFLSTRIAPRESEFRHFADTFKAWCSAPVQSIKSATELSRMMAGKARQIDYVIEHALSSDMAGGPDTDENESLRAQYRTFRELLIHDLSVELFADTYAQTIVYGMFAARLNDKTPDTFDRQEAAELIPKSNPFLRSLFGYISGPDLDDRVKPFIDDLAAVFRASNVHAILTAKKADKAFIRDPMVHFYEDFLREYDAALRKNRGVWYTPQPVVRFIVRGVDALLRSEFDLRDGLADASRIPLPTGPNADIPNAEAQRRGERKENSAASASSRLCVEDTLPAPPVSVHRVQVLDPACGTGTFLAEVIRLIHGKPAFAKNPGIWSQFASSNLVPRLNGFELLMASYVVAHIKLEMLLEETGAAPEPKRDRLHVYLTNSLEAPNKANPELFVNWLTKEAQAADEVKRDAPVFVVVGNPPYSGESFNKGTWASELVGDYKKDPSGAGTVPDTKWLNDDYVKFIRFGQHLIEKTGEGVLAFITPHGWLDAPTFRGMRHALLSFFDSIYVLDLHGNSRKKEKTPDGAKDDNVFPIVQGVEITFFVKKREGKPAGTLAAVRHAELWGKRREKLVWLDETAFESVPWKDIVPNAPQYFLVPRDIALEEEYKRGFDVSRLFPLGSVGICTKRDETAYRESRDEMRAVIHDFATLPPDAIKAKYPTERKESLDRKLAYAVADVRKHGLGDENFCEGTFRVFDRRWTYLTDQSKGFLARPVYEVMRHLRHPENVAFCCAKTGRSDEYHNYLVARGFVSKDVVCSLDSVIVFPLYVYQDGEDGDSFWNQSRQPNLDAELVAEFGRRVGLRYTPEKEETPGTFAPADILHYVYAVLYSPSYRARFKKVMRGDFPRVPFPESAEEFRRLAALGARLAAVHLLESGELDDPPATYPVGGDHRVDAPAFRDGRVYINGAQYFEGATERSWNFLIGGYQPAQKWLKDRRGRTLSPADILHYGKILRALDLTAEIMAEIDGTKGT